MSRALRFVVPGSILKTEIPPNTGQFFQETVNVPGGVVKIGARTRGRGDSQASVQGLGAVVTHADGDTGHVEDLTDVVGMDTVNDDRGQPHTFVPDLRTHQPDPGDLRDAAGKPLPEFRLPRRHVIHPDLLQESNRLGKGHHLGNPLGTGLKPRG